MTDELNLPPPTVRSKIYDACVDLYNVMRSEAVWDERHQSDVWTGSVVKLVERLGYYPRKASEAREHLERMQCVQYLQLGRSRKPSIVRLLTPPTPELWIGSRPSIRNAYHPTEIVEFSLIERTHKLEKEMKAVLQFLAEQFPELVRRTDAESDDARRSQALPTVQAADGRGEHEPSGNGPHEQDHGRGMSDGDLPLGQDSRTENDSDSP